MQKLIIKVSAFVFLLVALAHLSRLIWKFDIVIAGTSVPLWVNGVGFVIAAILSIGLFRTK